MTQKQQLAVLLLILGAIAAWRVATYAPPRVAQMKYVSGRVPASGAQREGAPLKVRLERMGKMPPPVPTDVRNIFAPLKSLEPPPPPPPAVEVEEMPPPPQVEAPSPEALALAAAQKALGEITYIGFLDRGAGKRTGLFSKSGQVAAGGKGEPLFERFRVHEISGASAIVEDAATHAQVTLQIAEKK